MADSFRDLCYSSTKIGLEALAAVAVACYWKHLLDTKKTTVRALKGVASTSPRGVRYPKGGPLPIFSALAEGQLQKMPWSPFCYFSEGTDFRPNSGFKGV